MHPSTHIKLKYFFLNEVGPAFNVTVGISVELINVTQTTFIDICSINSSPFMGKYFTYILISSRVSYNSIKVCRSFSQPQMYTVLSLWIHTN